MWLLRFSNVGFICGYWDLGRRVGGERDSLTNYRPFHRRRRLIIVFNSWYGSVTVVRCRGKFASGWLMNMERGKQIIDQ